MCLRRYQLWTPIVLSFVSQVEIGGLKSITGTTSSSSSSGGAAKSSSSSSGSGAGAFSKYSSAKGISSDTYFGSQDSDQLRESAARLSALGSAKAISSDMVFGDGGGAGGGGGGRGGYSSSSSYGGGPGGGPAAGDMSEFAEKLGAAVGEDLKRVTEAVASRASKLKEGFAAFADVMRR